LPEGRTVHLFMHSPMQWKYAAAATHGRGASRREGRSPARLLLHVQLKISFQGIPCPK